MSPLRPARVDTHRSHTFCAELCESLKFPQWGRGAQYSYIQAVTKPFILPHGKCAQNVQSYNNKNSRWKKISCIIWIKYKPCVLRGIYRLPLQKENPLYSRFILSCLLKQKEGECRRTSLRHINRRLRCELQPFFLPLPAPLQCPCSPLIVSQSSTSLS